MTASLEPAASLEAAASLGTAARTLGGYVWLESRVFEILGAWVHDVAEPEVKLRLAADSHHHAWHAALWRERLPVSQGSDGERLIAPAIAWAAFVTAFEQSLTTLERLTALYRVLLPRQVARYQDHLDTASSITDGPTIRALELVLADDLADWRRGERLLQRHLVSAGDAVRAAAHQGMLESILVAGVIGA
jgi:hypothetical protein